MEEIQKRDIETEYSEFFERVMNEVFNGERDLHMLEKRTIVEWIEDFHLPEIIVLELLEWCVHKGH